jgi:Tfp pilus assembly protein PilZ
MQKPKSAQERRIHQRIKSSIGVNVNSLASSDYTHLRNISSGGAFIHSFVQTDYHIGQNIIVTLPAKESKKLKVISKIVWMDKDGIGVKFLKHQSMPG